MDQVHGYFVGLDLGQVQDYTALAVIEAADTKGAWDPVQLYFRRHRELRLRHLERMPLGRPYPEMVARTEQVMRSGALASASRYLAHGCGTAGGGSAAAAGTAEHDVDGSDPVQSRRRL